MSADGFESSALIPRITVTPVSPAAQMKPFTSVAPVTDFLRG